MNKPVTLSLGQVVRILRGKGADQHAVIVSIEDSKYVKIADGHSIKFDQAKKKNILHLMPQSFISSEVVNSLQESGRVTNGKLRFAVSRFLSENPNADQKGE
ncbi:KOW domain-containing RNA-binding protein [Paenibacillus sp. F411]|uniref:KOW domain protein n=1 Tax=Paenibacillus algicola TaxID=2565926 RepID=A0A4P8XR97_9BACL|nr:MULTISPECIES: KOW domain-containing RNA-binding protein [Paenibacillus]MBO2945796.1 KOW domain-containing RNA-binding protein [Paenibacillus sp. F411]QCT04420.1 KOW domain protein [Paenibacillus algicola]